MLFELRAGRAAPAPRCRPGTPPDNEPLLKVNAELGFQPDREWYEYGADVAPLVHRLTGLTRAS